MKRLLLACVLVCGCAPKPEAGPQPKAPVGPTGLVGVANLESDTRDITVSDRMWHHFADVARARDAVIFGDLAQARAPLNRLAAGRYGREMPKAWDRPLSKMEAEARRGAQASELSVVAASVAAVAAQCGQCHLDHGGGPALEGEKAGYRPHGREGLEEAMARHVWAAEELWLGLTVPLDAAWQRGAEALSHTEAPPEPEAKADANEAKPPASPAADAVPDYERGVTGQALAPADAGAPAAPATPPDPAFEPETQQALDAIRALGDRALAAHSLPERQALYAELLQRCVRCHAAKR